MKQKLLFILFFIFSATNTWAQLPGGGTASDPYLISTVSDLVFLSENARYTEDLYFKLANNLDLTGYDSGGGKGWAPIGKSLAPFRGIFDGGNHTINGLTINNNEAYMGLFGVISGGVVKNLNLTNINIKNSYRRTGGLAGQSEYGALISNCSVSGVIETGDDHTGGLIGFYSYGDININNCSSSVNISSAGTGTAGIIGYLAGINVTVDNCTSTGKVVGKRNTGGIIGELYNTGISIIQNNHTSGDITGLNNVGGLIGGIREYMVSYSITDCDATGNISGEDYIGGLIGKTSPYAETIGIIENCFALGDVSGEDYVGGFAGSNDEQVTIRGCYARGDVSGEIINTLGNRYIGGFVGENRGYI